MKFGTLAVCLLLLGSAVDTVGVALPAQSTAMPPAASDPRGIEGNWQGVLNSPVGKLRLVLEVSRAGDGALKATMEKYGVCSSWTEMHSRQVIRPARMGKAI